jgi:hypothetical protein
MRATDVGVGGAGTIVLNPDLLRNASSFLVGAAERDGSLAARIRSHQIPELPPGLGVLPAQLAALAAAVASEVPVLQETAQELRVRALWGDIADRLIAGVDLDGALLDEFKVAMASGLLTRYGEPWQDELANAYVEKLKDEEDHGGVLGFVEDVAGGIADFFEGAWDAVAQPVAMLYRLTPLNEDWTHQWEQLGSGLAYGATHPLEFGKALIALDALQERGVAYWLGNLAPAVAATVVSGGGAAAVRGASGTERMLATSSRLKAVLAKPGHAFQHDVLHPGPLTPTGASLTELRTSAAQTFAGGKYDLVASKQPYVVFKAGENPGGRFFSFDPPVSEAQVRIDSAVKPVWTDAHGNYVGSSRLEKGYAFAVENPKHPVPMGPVGEQGGVYLGGHDRIQVFIDDRTASQLRLIEEWPLKHPPDWVRGLQGAGP